MNIANEINNVFLKDPAARNTLEVILCYPGLHAVWLHKLSHFLWKVRLLLLARIVSNVSRFLTGIEIHPGATIGDCVFIDHGMGIVIGETSEVGNNCLLYQGVVLGGVSHSHGKRHPTLGNDVVVGAGAILLGPIHIGNNARIGAGSVVIRDVPENTTVVGVPAMPTSDHKRDELNHTEISDPISNRITQLEKRIQYLENK